MKTKYLLCLVCGLLPITSVGIRAENNTNDVDIARDFPAQISNALPPADFGVEAVYASKMKEVGNTLAFDSFGPFSELRWTRDIDSYSYFDRFNSAGKNTVDNILGYSLRETAVSTFRLEDQSGFARNLIAGSIGNTIEGRTYQAGTYSVAETSWWKDALSGNSIKYGLRLGSRMPYAYLMADIGRSHDEQLMTIESRVRYEPFDRERFEERVLVPLLNNWRVNLGLSVSLSRSNYQNNDRLTASISLDRTIGRRPFSGSVFSVGVFTNEINTTVNAEFFISF